MKKILILIGLFISANVYAQPKQIYVGGDVLTVSGDTLYKNGVFLAELGGGPSVDTTGAFVNSLENGTDSSFIWWKGGVPYTITVRGVSGSTPNIHQVLGQGDSTFRKIVWKDTAASSTGITRWQLKPRDYGTIYPSGSQAVGKIEMFDAKYSYNAGVNGSGRPNIIASWMDYNGGFGNNRYNNTEASFSFRAESHYEMQGGRWFEFHLPEMCDSAGNVRRLWTFYTRKTDGYTNLTSQINTFTLLRGRTDTAMFTTNQSAMRYYSESNSSQFSIGSSRVVNNFSAISGDNGVTLGLGAINKSQSAFSFLGRGSFRIDTAYGGNDSDAALNLVLSTPTGQGINLTTSGRGNSSTGIQWGMQATFSTTNFANVISATNNTGNIRTIVSTSGGEAQYRLNNWAMRNNQNTGRNALYINPTTNSDSAFAIIPTVNFIKMKYSVGIGTADPTARLTLPAGTATASTAPLKFTSGTLLTTEENGAVEYDGTNYHVTSGGVRYLLTRTLTGSAPPATTPAAVGIQFVDTVNKKIYVSVGTSSSADWEILN